MNLRIAIITWVKYYNQGSFLQAYALQNYLRQNNYIVDILWDGFMRTDKPTFIKRIKGKLVSPVKSLFLGKKNLSDGFKPFYDEFRKNKLSIKYIETEEDLRNLDMLYDVYVCGSDQIWNPFSITYPFYYASFSHNKKIAYAPSLGTQEYPENNRSILRDLLKDFSSLSCRETVGANILSDITGRNDIMRVVDPTLLLDGDAWRKLFAMKKKSTLPIVFAYFLTPNERYLSFARQLSNAKGLRLVILHNFKEYEKYADEMFRGHPDEFVQMIDSASIVVTDSFHGTVFSLLMRTPFITLQRFLKGKDKGQNTRISNLFEMMDSGRMYDDQDCDNAVPFDDFKRAWQNLQPHIEDSKKYLLQAIEN